MVIQQEVELELPHQVRARLLEALRDGDALMIELQDFVLALHGRSKAVLRFEARPRGGKVPSLSDARARPALERG